uniref:Uncharacterized protein n=1 Tax=Setaria italica TaxID=4555 RepID=K3ZG62_SETIT
MIVQTESIRYLFWLLLTANCSYAVHLVVFVDPVSVFPMWRSVPLPEINERALAMEIPFMLLTVDERMFGAAQQLEYF